MEKMSDLFKNTLDFLHQNFAVSKMVLTFAMPTILWAGDARCKGFFYACTFIKQDL
jgi:hypothetical protein